MSFNEIAYLIYLPLAAYITVVVGYRFHQHGIHLIKQLFAPNFHLATTTNNLLLIGYYLVNLGGVALSIRYMGDIGSYAHLFIVLSKIIGSLCLVLAVLHYNNIFWLYYFSTRQHLINFLSSKT